MSIKADGDSAYEAANCVGSIEEELEVKIVTKNCRGTVLKQRTRGAGNGTLTTSLHVPYVIYNKLYDMNRADLASGVKAYGTPSVHKEFSLVLHVKDEDGAEKYKAYPKCIMTSGPNRSIENGADEVAELEIEIGVMPDDYGYCVYEALAVDLSESIKNAWMTGFTPELVRGTSTLYSVTNALSHITTENITTSIPGGDTYRTKLTAESGYSLPSTITVTIGEETATAGTDYIYMQASGTLVIPDVSGNIAITATGAL